MAENELLALAQTQSQKLHFAFPCDLNEWADNGFPMENYHKHTTWSNVFQIDSATSLQEFADFNKERGAKCLFSGEHGYQGEWLYVYDFCHNREDKPKFRYSTEAYWVKDRHEKDNTNCHIVLVARNYRGLRKLNYIISMANIDGFYYKPRIDLDLLFQLEPEDVYVTSACIAGWKYEDAPILWYNIWKHFGDSFFLEYQCHNTERQKEVNRQIQKMASEYGIQTIVGLDTHYVSEEDRVKRDNLLKRKGLHYDDEDSWYMDYPDSRTVYERLIEQCVLSPEEIMRSIMNTQVFVNGCEEIELNTDFKIPVLPMYQNLTYEERVAELKRILNEQYAKTETNKSKSKIAGLRYEAEQISTSGIADYFLDDYHIVKLATSPEYGGHLTTTGRGSAGSYYANKLLGLTTLDRFEAEVPIYPERFMTKERIEASHQCADIDLNCSDSAPFVKASKDLLGEESCYPLLAVGTLKAKNAFKLYASVKGVDPQIANEVTSQLDDYEEAVKNADDDAKSQISVSDFIKDKELYRIYQESIPYQNIVEQAKVHACGHLLFNGDQANKDVIGYGDIRYEIGLILCSSETSKKQVLVACVEGSLLDTYGYVKNDYLIVTVVSIIHKLYEAIGRKVPTVAELREMVDGDEATWSMYAEGKTCCLNQCEKTATTRRVMQYKPQNVKELAAFIAGIRPGFRSLLDGFLARVDYTSGEAKIDEMLQDSFHYMLYQESTMKLFQYLGISMREAYDTIKKISKKKLVGKALEKVEKTLKKHWLGNIGNLDNFDAVYNVVKDSARYQFNSVHALSMAFDSLYEAYIKAHYPEVFFTVVLNHYDEKGDKEKVASLLKEANEMFGYKIGSYTYGHDHSHFNIENGTIYPCFGSIKGIGAGAAKSLNAVSKCNYSELFDAIRAIRNAGVNSTVMENLAKIGFFSPFCSTKKAVLSIDLYSAWKDRKTITKQDAKEYGLSDGELNGCATDELASGNVSKTKYSITNGDRFIKVLIDRIPNDEYGSVTLAKNEFSVLGHINTKDVTVDRHICVVTSLDTKYSPRLTAYCVATGTTAEFKVHKKKDPRMKGKQSSFDETPFQEGDAIIIGKCEKKRKQRKINGEWVPVPGVFEWWIEKYSVT